MPAEGGFARGGARAWTGAVAQSACVMAVALPFGFCRGTRAARTRRPRHGPGQGRFRYGASTISCPSPAPCAARLAGDLPLEKAASPAGLYRQWAERRLPGRAIIQVSLWLPAYLRVLGMVDLVVGEGVTTSRFDGCLRRLRFREVAGGQDAAKLRRRRPPAPLSEVPAGEQGLGRRLLCGNARLPPQLSSGPIRRTSVQRTPPLSRFR